MKISQPLKTTLFPYTTLFRSRRESLRCNPAHCDTFCARPRSPIGRGSRLKIDPVWVRVPSGVPVFALARSCARYAWKAKGARHTAQAGTRGISACGFNWIRLASTLATVGGTHAGLRRDDFVS